MGIHERKSVISSVWVCEPECCLLYKCSTKAVLMFACTKDLMGPGTGEPRMVCCSERQMSRVLVPSFICVKQNSRRPSIGNGVVVCLLRNLLSKYQGRR